MKSNKNWIKYNILILMIFLIFGLCVIITEWIAQKKMGLGQPIIYDAHPLWGYSPRANKKYFRFKGDVVTINNVGVRSTEKWRNDGKNILFLGDSVTYGGSYINDNETFVYLACTELQNWSCFNAGVNGYGILNMVARSRYDSRISDAPLRIFTFITDDFDRGLQKSNTAHFILREPPKKFNAIWEILNFVSSNISPKTWFGKKSDIIDQNRILNEKKVSQKFALDIFLDELERLDEEGLNYLIIHSPSVSEIKNSQLIKNNHIILKIKNQYPERFYTLTEFFKESYNINNQLIFKDDVHYEELGHLLASKKLSQILTKVLKKIENKNKNLN